MFRPALALAAVCVVLAGSPATAQQRPACTDRSNVLSHLSTRYSETPVAMGVANNGGVIEILSSKSGKSWTIILTMPNGMTCMIAAGENWEALPELADLGPSA
jgi:hypothetical protein